MRRITISILLVLVPLSATWSAPMVLDRDTSVQLALENNPDFLISGIDLDIAEREDRNSWNSFLPTTSAGVGLNGGSAAFDDRPNQMAWSFNASLDMSLALNAGLASTINGLQLAYEAEEIGYETSRQMLVAQVESEFFYLVASQANLEIEKANVDLALKRYDQAKVNFDNGLASELSMLQAEVSAKNLEPAYLQTVASYDSRVKEFLIVLGLDPSTEVSLEGTLETPELTLNADELIRNYVPQRQDIQSLNKSIEILENARTSTNVWNRTPTLALSAGWSTQVGDPFNAGSWNYATWTDGLSLGMNLSIPLDDFIPGSSTSVSVNNLDDQIEQAWINLAKTTDSARTEIINLVNQLETSRASMELSELNVELARRSYEMSEESYARGTLQRLDVEDAQQSYLEANQQYLLSQYEYLSGLIGLRTALGLDSLEELL